MAEYTTTVIDSGNPDYTSRILVGTPVTGLVRVEWVQARYGQIIPCNWGHVVTYQFLNSYYPLRYQVADAQNIIVHAAVTQGFQWCLLWEHDTIPPADATLRLDKHMAEGKYPVISGLYYTRSIPSDPLVFRGAGNGVYRDFKLGDKVMVDGVPTGFLLIHGKLLQEMYKDAEPYQVSGVTIRRVFTSPRDLWFDADKGVFNSSQGTSDLDWCKRVIAGNYLAKAGWPELQAEKYPFLIDTEIACLHCNPDGSMFPPGGYGQ